MLPRAVNETVNIAVTTPVEEHTTEIAPTTSSSELSKDVRKAEILWCLYLVENHMSFNSTAHLSELFAAMFPDSAIASGYTCGSQ